MPGPVSDTYEGPGELAPEDRELPSEEQIEFIRTNVDDWIEAAVGISELKNIPRYKDKEQCLEYLGEELVEKMEILEDIMWRLMHG